MPFFGRPRPGGAGLQCAITRAYANAPVQIARTCRPGRSHSQVWRRLRVAAQSGHVLESLLTVAKSAAPAAPPAPDGTITTVLAVLALMVSAYGASLATRTHRWQRRRDEHARRSDITIDIGEHADLGGQDLIIGQTVQRRHILTVVVINRGEAPEFVHARRPLGEQTPQSGHGHGPLP
jgi:hypothetical protein